MDRDDHEAALARIAVLEAKVATLEEDNARLEEAKLWLEDENVRLRAARQAKLEPRLRGIPRTLPAWFIAVMLLALLGFGWLLYYR